MRNPKMLPTLDELSSQQYLLSEDIRAIELRSDELGKMRLGPVSTIPAGSEVECRGQGFTAAGNSCSASTTTVPSPKRLWIAAASALEMVPYVAAKYVIAIAVPNPHWILLAVLLRSSMCSCAQCRSRRAAGPRCTRRLTLRS